MPNKIIPVTNRGVFKIGSHWVRVPRSPDWVHAQAFEQGRLVTQRPDGDKSALRVGVSERNTIRWLETLRLKDTRDSLSGVEVAGRLYSAPTLYLSAISHPFSNFEVPVEWRLARRCYVADMGDFSFNFPGNVDNRIVRAARAGQLFMLGGVFSPVLEFVWRRSEETDFSLFSIATHEEDGFASYARWIMDRQRRWFCLADPHSVPLVDFYPDVVMPDKAARKKIIDQEVSIEVEPRMFEKAQSYVFAWGVKIGLGGDAEWREMMREGIWSLKISSHRIVLHGPNGYTLSVPLKDWEVMGSDGRPYVNAAGNRVRFNSPKEKRINKMMKKGLARRAQSRGRGENISGAEAASSTAQVTGDNSGLASARGKVFPTFNFFEGALRRDKGVLTAAEPVTIDELSSVLLDPERRHDIGFVARNVRGSDGAIWVPVGEEGVPITSTGVEKVLKEGTVAVVIKKRFGKVYVAVHRESDGAFVNEFEFDKSEKRFIATIVCNGQPARREYVDFVLPNWRLDRYAPGCFLNDRHVQGSIIFVRIGKDGLPIVRTRATGELIRNVLFNRAGEPWYLFGRLQIGNGLRNIVAGWLPNIKVCGTQYFYVSLWGENNVVPIEIARSMGLTTDTFVDVYIENGRVVGVRKNGEERWFEV